MWAIQRMKRQQNNQYNKSTQYSKNIHDTRQTLAGTMTNDFSAEGILSNVTAAMKQFEPSHRKERNQNNTTCNCNLRYYLELEHRHVVHNPEGSRKNGTILKFSLKAKL